MEPIKTLKLTREKVKHIRIRTSINAGNGSSNQGTGAHGASTPEKGNP
jgi:hypothetical protein